MTPVSLTMTTSSHVLPKSLAKIILLHNVIRAVEEDYQIKQETDYNQSVPHSTSLYHYTY
jgi:hypothetical protein